jgi:hypothetical protein
VATANDVLGTFGRTVVIDTPTLRDRTVIDPRSRSAFVGFVYNFAKGPPRRQQQPGFEFDPGSVPAS